MVVVSYYYVYHYHTAFLGFLQASRDWMALINESLFLLGLASSLPINTVYLLTIYVNLSQNYIVQNTQISHYCQVCTSCGGVRFPCCCRSPDAGQGNVRPLSEAYFIG